MEVDKTARKYSVKGGKTILGRIFEYQKETGLSPKEIMKLPYIFFVISMVDAPQIDYESKDKKAEIAKPKTADEEIAALTSIFK